MCGCDLTATRWQCDRDEALWLIAYCSYCWAILTWFLIMFRLSCRYSVASLYLPWRGKRGSVNLPWTDGLLTIDPGGLVPRWRYWQADISTKQHGLQKDTEREQVQFSHQKSN